MEKFLPRTTDRIMERTLFRQQQKDEQHDPHASALGADEGETKGELAR